ncbi:(2Fe-2S)-binding protein [Cohnella panacarvi]|uniref:(2Fe-2S)-binding protein n=1 Tax=Cohnella panacarvi TaxID=400776 RepID=UPI00047D2F46|nr:(2Fe-2S)-binding protein [Cohnella panacarvi]
MLPFDPNLLVSRHKLMFDAPDRAATTYSFAGSDAAGQLSVLLDRFGEQLESDDPGTTARIFFKRYCPLFAGAVYAWIRHRYPLDVAFGNMRLVQSGANMKFYLISDAPAEGIDDNDETYLRHLFHEHAAPLISLVAAASGVSRPALWHTIAYAISYWKHEWLYESSSAETSERIERWFQYATARANPAWLPGKSANPIACEFRAVDDPLHEGRKILIRKACCLNYKLAGDDRGYCVTCPLISDERRLDQYLESHAH